MERVYGDRGVQGEGALEETEAEIERTRARLSASLGALREEISDLASWRTWVANRPVPFVAGAFALGFLVGLATSGRGR
jgi:hypothetical protein